MPDAWYNGIKEMQALLHNAGNSGDELDLDTIRVDNIAYKPTFVVEKLKSFLSGNRQTRIEDVLQGRSYTVATVVEGLVNTGNVSAIMRTAEALGFQPFHIINNGGKFKKSERISHGAEKWLSVYQWDEPETCAMHLKKQGYTVVATTLDEYAVPLSSIDFTRKTALVFGNEANGVTRGVLKNADQTCYIPMTGFTQSLNISVAAAIGMYHAFDQRNRELGRHGDLTTLEKTYLRALYYLRSVNKGERILGRRDSNP